jgi:hypothetical protein
MWQQWEIDQQLAWAQMMIDRGYDPVMVFAQLKVKLTK